MTTDPNLITQEEIEAARDHGMGLFVELLDHLEELDLDDAAVVYSLWVDLTRYLADCGWTAEELTKDLHHHVADQSCEGRA